MNLLNFVVIISVVQQSLIEKRDLKEYIYRAVTTNPSNYSYADVFPVTEMRIGLGIDTQTGRSSERFGEIEMKGKQTIIEKFGSANCPSDWLCLGGVVRFAIPIFDINEMKTWNYDDFIYEHTATTDLEILGNSYRVDVIHAMPTGYHSKGTHRLFYFSKTDGLICILFYSYVDGMITGVSSWWSATPTGFGALTIEAQQKKRRMDSKARQ